jgi:hypothetical protein
MRTVRHSPDTNTRKGGTMGRKGAKVLHLPIGPGWSADLANFELLAETLGTISEVLVRRLLQRLPEQTEQLIWAAARIPPHFNNDNAQHLHTEITQLRKLLGDLPPSLREWDDAIVQSCRK